MSGTVFLEDFDRGIVESLGAELMTIQVEGGERQQYVCSVTGVEGPPEFKGAVPVFFIVGSSPFTPKWLPCVIIRRTDIELAFQNGGQSWGIQYKQPAPGAQIVVVTMPDATTISGPTHKEILERSLPHNIRFDVQAKCRGSAAMRDANRLLKFVMRSYPPPGSKVTVKDSLGDSRGYDVIHESYASNNEVLDLTARDVGWTLTLVIHGELDITEPYSERTVTTLPNTTIVSLE
jgi:hypothetical protein